MVRFLRSFALGRAALIAAGLLGVLASADAQRCELFIDYKLPGNPDLAADARLQEANFLTTRNVELQACANGHNPSECDRNAEIAFRRRLSAIPQGGFGLYFECDKAGKGTFAFLVKPDEAVDPSLDRLFRHLQPTVAHSLGIDIELRPCRLVQINNGRPISYNEVFTRTACDIIGRRKAAKKTLDDDDILDELIDSDNPDLGELAFFIEHADLTPTDLAFAMSFAIIDTLKRESVSLKVVSALLDGGAEINGVSDTKELPPLSYAADLNSVAMVKLLLGRRANVDIRDDKGRTPLFWAKSAAVAGTLLDNRASINAMDNSGQIPLWFASGNSNCAASATGS